MLLDTLGVYASIAVLFRLKTSIVEAARARAGLCLARISYSVVLGLKLNIISILCSLLL